MAGKPEVKVYLKSKAGQFLDLFAFWRNDNGMLSGKCDRGVVAIKAVMADGSEVVLKPNEKGYIDGWFVNVRLPEGQSAPSPQRAQPTTRRAAAPPPVDDFDDGDLPF
jgi:hypothetical protein